MSEDVDVVFERNYALAEPHTLLMKAQVRSIFDRLLEVRHLPGDCIEFGGFRGGLSFFLGLCLRDLGLAKRVFMLDSFQGLPQTDAMRDGPFKGGMMVSDLPSVLRQRTALGLDDIVEVRAGWFEDSLAQMPPAAQFCLAHLDADIYASTKTALRYILPQLTPGGALILDDCLFFGATGVVQAAEEEIGSGLHLHLGPKTQAFTFPRGDPHPDRPAPVWRTLDGRRYDVAELLQRADYLELVSWEAAYFRDHAQWYRNYMELVSGNADLPPDSHRIVARIGTIRHR